MIRVLLVDDQPLIRSGFRALLDIEDDIEVVAEAADGSEGVAFGPPAPARHRAHRHSDAGPRRHRGDSAHRRQPGPDRGARRHPHQLRATPDSHESAGSGTSTSARAARAGLQPAAAVSISGLSALRRDASSRRTGMRAIDGERPVPAVVSCSNPSRERSRSLLGHPGPTGRIAPMAKLTPFYSRCAGPLRPVRRFLRVVPGSDADLQLRVFRARRHDPRSRRSGPRSTWRWASATCARG